MAKNRFGAEQIATLLRQVPIHQDRNGAKS